MDAPTLITDRLTIAPLAASRFEQHFSNMSDARVVEWLGSGQPQERIEAWRRFCQGAGLWPLLGYGYWSVIERASDRMIGMGGFARFERGIAQLDGVPEAGWAFAHDAWGKGIASEFLATAISWADAAIDAAEIRCIISPGNGASIRVAEKNGFTQIDSTADVFGEIGVYARLRQPSPSGGDQAPS
jgi:RimJ/RimL family protein N-acetyltransferase